MTKLVSFKGPADVSLLNEYLETRSYIEDFHPSQADAVVFDALAHAKIDHKGFVHVVRWYMHIKSFGDKKSKFPGTKKSIDQLHIEGTGAPATPHAHAHAPSAAHKKPVDDDLDLFGSDEEEDAEAEALKAQRLAEYQAKKSTKPKVIAKSSVIIDVKPWEDTTDMKEMEERVRAITMDGLIWGTAKLVAIGYGIKKLQISCAIEDDKVSMDSVEEQIIAIEELVQSMDIVSFNKI